MLDSETLAAIREGTEADMSRYHHGLGLSIRNRWGLWGKSRLKKHMCELGFHHADDMSAVIRDTFWAKLHKKPFRLEERAAHYDAYWKCSTWPTLKSPIDGKAIEWVIQLNHCPKHSVSLGWSVSDGSPWRFEYPGGRAVEPAGPHEREKLEELRAERRNREVLNAFWHCLEVNHIPKGSACDACAAACQAAARDASTCVYQETQLCGLPMSPSLSAIEPVIEPLLSEARKCVPQGEPGTQASVEFQSDGTVRKVEVEGPFTTEPTKQCIRDALEKATIPRFAEHTAKLFWNIPSPQEAEGED